MTDARATQIAAYVLEAPEVPPTRVTQLIAYSLEPLPGPPVRMTQEAAYILQGQDPPPVRLTQEAVYVLESTATPPIDPLKVCAWREFIDPSDRVFDNPMEPGPIATLQTLVEFG